MSTILITYLRLESYEITNQIADRLIRQFGQQITVMEELFFPPGIPTCEFVEQRIAKCDVLLPVIGPTWMETYRGDKFDHVQTGIESALIRKIPVIPVLVLGVKILLTERLPGSLQGLFDRHGLDVRSDAHFHGDMDRLIESLKQSMNDRSSGPKSETD